MKNNHSTGLFNDEKLKTYLNYLYKAGIPDPPSLKPELAERREQERHFLEQLLNSSKLEPYHIAVPISASLRKYQQVSECFGSTCLNISL